MPRFNSTINQGKMFVDVILSKNKYIQYGKKFTALIDTGATNTIIKKSVADKMFLLIKDETPIKVNMSNSSMYSVLYDASIFVVNRTSLL